MSKKLLSIVICAMLIATVLPINAFAAPAAFRVSGVSGTGSGITAVVNGAGGGWTKIGCIVYQGGSVVWQGFVPYSGASSVSIPVPANNIAANTYKVSVWGTNNDASNSSEIFTFDVPLGRSLSASVSHVAVSLANRYKYNLAITVPYADVFSDSSMRTVRATIVHFQRVNARPTVNPNIVYIEYEYIPDGATPVIGTGAGGWDVITNTHIGVGYVYASALRSVVFGKDAQREFVEYCYSRLGIQGVYNQVKRWDTFYADCSSLVWSAANHVTEGFNNCILNGDPTAGGEAAYMESRPAAVVWSSIDTKRVPYGPSNAIFNSGYGHQPTWAFMDTPPSGLMSMLQPGDTLHFSWRAENSSSIYYRAWEVIGYDDENGAIYGWVYHPLYDPSGKPRDIEPEKVYGIDHVAVYIGNGKIIHAADRGSNTLIATLSVALLNDVVFVGRPLALLP